MSQGQQLMKGLKGPFRPENLIWIKPTDHPTVNVSKSTY